METPVNGYSWRDGIDQLMLLATEEIQPGKTGMVLARDVLDIVEAVRRWEDDTDESIRSALWEEAIERGDYDEEGQR